MENCHPLISVIIPIYKVEDYLCECIDSVLEQTYQNLEVILVDDGSPDNCGVICDDYATKDPRIKVVHKENGGLSDARNAGLGVSTGDYIWFVDSDDWISQDAFPIIFSEIENEDFEMLGFSYQDYNDENETFGLTSASNMISMSNGLEYIEHNGYFEPTAWAYIYKRSFLQQHGLKFKVGMIHEDDHFNLRAFSVVRKIKKINKVLYYYRRREGTLSNIKASERLIVSYIALVTLCQDLPQANFPKHFIHKKQYDYLSKLFQALVKWDISFSQKQKYISVSKKEARKMILLKEDLMAVKILKASYNLSGNLYYFIIKLYN